MLGLALVLAAKRKFGSERVKGTLRVVAYGAVVCLGLTTYTYRSAKAEVGRSSIQVGRDLAQLVDLLKEANDIRINGQDVHVANTLTKEPLGSILDRFDSNCASAPGALGEAWREVANAEGVPSPPAGVSSTGVLRHETRKEGVVLCLVRGTQTPGTLREAAHLFSQTHDLGTLGKLRYAYARATGQGSTTVLTVWTDDRFDLGALFPESGEAPGRDPEGIPRPPSSRRLMSIDVAHTPFGNFVYRSEKSPAELLSFYDTTMEAQGWGIIEPPNAAGAGRAYMKDGAQFVVAADKDDEGNTIVSIGEIAARPEGR